LRPVHRLHSAQFPARFLRLDRRGSLVGAVQLDRLAGQVYDPGHHLRGWGTVSGPTENHRSLDEPVVGAVLALFIGEQRKKSEARI